MSVTPPSSRKRLFRILWILVGLVALGVVLAAAGFTFAASKETHDPFCASCHTQPESTFYQRSIDPQSIDLASYHMQQETRCIDCHSGVGILGRMRAELMGARNAATWYTGTAVQPAVLTVPVGDANCLKCHQDVTSRGYTPKNPITIFGGDREGGEREGEAGNNHWHELLARWQASGSQAGTCVSCHPGHTTDGTAQTGFQNTGTTRNECETCHRALGEGRD